MDLSEVEKFERAKVGTITLSEAIRLGARLHPKCNDVLFNGEGTCAIGAAAVGRGWTPEYLDAWRTAGAFLPELMGDDQSMNKRDSLFYKIGSRNDEGWTREEIADWLESQGL
jgi:hypothetical protein